MMDPALVERIKAAKKILDEAGVPPAEQRLLFVNGKLYRGNLDGTLELMESECPA